MPKATFMYWQKRFNRKNPDQEIETKIIEICHENKDYGYRRMTAALKNQSFKLLHIREKVENIIPIKVNMVE